MSIECSKSHNKNTHNNKTQQKYRSFYTDTNAQHILHLSTLLAGGGYVIKYRKSFIFALYLIFSAARGKGQRE